MTPSADGTQVSFTVTLDSSLAPDGALRRILDLRQHDRIIPFTRVTPTMAADQLRPGTEFVARTGIGPVGFDDVMRVERINLGDEQSEAGALISKHGRAIRGTIQVTITPSSAGSHISWHQSVHLPWLPGFVHAPAVRIIRLGYRRVLSQVLRA